MQLTNSGNWTA